MTELKQWTKEELEILQSDALAGDSKAQCDLGSYYSFIGRNKEAFNWFEKSALQGNDEGQYNLGLCYQYGRGVQKDVGKAIEWCMKSASQGNGVAACWLGRTYESGYQGKYLNKVQPSPSEAFYWYRIGYDMPKYRHFTGLDLARCYELGIGTPKCLYRAYELYKKHKANEQISHLLKSYNPLLDSRLSELDVLGNNPFRILGVYSNASEREIRANRSKLDSMVKVGQSPNFKTDHLLPCNISDYTGVCQERINYANTLLSTKGSSQYTSQANELLDRAIKELSEWASIKENNPEWQVSVSRTTETVSDSVQKIASDTQRIKYGLFWFSDYTDDDKKALKLLSEHKWDEARCIWDSCSNFSAHINRSVLSWFERDDYSAILEILNLIHSDEERSAYISSITSGRYVIPREDLSTIFWKTLLSFPQSEMSLYDFRSIITQSEETPIGLFLNQHESERELIKKMLFDEIKAPLENSLNVAESQDPNDWERSTHEYYKVYSTAYNILTIIERVVGKDYYGYILFCNRLAESLLQFSIHYNNDNKEAIDASRVALMYGKKALRMAKDEILLERCRKNVQIIEKNYHINQTRGGVELIEKGFCQIEGEDSSLNKIEVGYKTIELGLTLIGDHSGYNSKVFCDKSNEVVNRLMNMVVKICNKNKDFTTASMACLFLKKLLKMTMTTETKNRLECNIGILSKNEEYYLQKGKLGNTISFLDANRTNANVEKGHSIPTSNPKHKNSAKENRNRLLHKGMVSVVSILLTAFTYWCVIKGNPEKWFVISSIVALSILVLFNIIMWFLELQKDSADSYFDFFHSLYEKTEEIANSIESTGARDGKTYSWPFAIPFHLLAILFAIIVFFVNGLARIASLIK